MKLARRLARCAAAAGLAAVLALAPAGAGAASLVEPGVLLGAEARDFARMLAIRAGQADRNFAADVVVVMFEPAGVARVVLVDLGARRKAWAVLSLGDLMAILAMAGEDA